MSQKPSENFLKFRIPIPKPIISKEMDEKFLYYSVIEQMERGKVMAGTPDKNLNLTALVTARSMKLYMSSIMYIFIPLYLYRRFKYKKTNTTIRAFLKTFAISAILIFWSEAIFLSSAQKNYDTFLSDLLKTDDKNVISQYNQFKEEYDKLNKNNA